MNFFWKRLRVALIWNTHKRTRYIVKHKMFYSVGNNFTFQPRIIPLDCKYIKFGNNVHVASNVTFVAHDIIHYVFNGKFNNTQLPRYKSCIEIGNNVFIGSNTTI